MTLHVRRLEPKDDRSGFRSGDPDLDRFFVRFAGQNQFKHHIGTTYLAIEDAFIAGYVTVASSELTPEQMPAASRKRLPRYPVPVVRLARMASDERACGRGVGTTLLRSVFVLAHQMAADYGCAGVLVDAKHKSISFYERFGFEPLASVAGELGDRPQPLPMFLELAQVPSAK